MDLSFSIQDREPIWTALSVFYLDTELSHQELLAVAKTFKNSEYTLEEIKNINRYEVYPVLYQNVLSMYGIWDGFDKDWLIESIILEAKKSSTIRKITVQLKYFIFNGKKIIDWDKVS